MSNAQQKRLKGTLEVIGLVAVLASLLFVGVELRQNTAAIQSQTSQDLMDSAHETLDAIITNAEFAEFILNAERSLADLSEVDRYRYRWYVHRDFDIWEQAFYEHAEGTLNDRLWRAYDKGSRAYFCQPAPAEIWREIKFSFGVEFREHLDKGGQEACIEALE